MTRRGKGPEQAARSSAEGELYVLRLFVAGDERNSRRAKANLARICRTHLEGRCEVEVVDVFEDFQAALDERVLVTPSLILAAPLPRATVVGDLSDTDSVLAALRLKSGD